MTTTTRFSNDLLTVWEEYRKAAKRSRSLKRLLNRSRITGLILVVGGAVLGVLAGQSVGKADISVMVPDILAVLSAVALAAAAFVSRHVLDSQYERQWVLARSQAEALKSEAYTYLVKVPPYDGDDRDAILEEKTRGFLEESAHPVRLEPEEKHKRLPEDWLTMEDYMRDRVTDQIEHYYEPKALECQDILKRLRMAAFLLGLTGAALGAVSTTTVTKWPAAWVAVIGTITAALAAFTFAGRYQYLITSYALTARRLTWLRNAWYRVSGDEKASKAGEFVRLFESAISVENSAWLAEWTKRTESQSPAGGTISGD